MVEFLPPDLYPSNKFVESIYYSNCSPKLSHPSVIFIDTRNTSGDYELLGLFQSLHDCYVSPQATDFAWTNLWTTMVSPSSPTWTAHTNLSFANNHLASIGSSPARRLHGPYGNEGSHMPGIPSRKPCWPPSRAPTPTKYPHHAYQADKKRQWAKIVSLQMVRK